MARHNARRHNQVRLTDRPGIWFNQHLQNARAAFERLARSPVPTAMTVAVIGISLALPAALYVVTLNLRAAAGGWDQSAAISLFLKYETSDAEAQKLEQKLQGWPEVRSTHLVSREAALAEFRALGGFEEALDQLTRNPLPVVIAIYPASSALGESQLEALRTRLGALPEADFARMDTLWIKRFQAILDLVQRSAFLLGALLALGVLMIVGNTIRLEILNRRVEIEIKELVGATSSFIRRPFLYVGAWYGALGGITAWLLLSVAIVLLQRPVSRLATLYHSQFPLSGLSLLASLVLLLIGLLLGLLGSWLAVSRHLSDASPR